MKRKRYTEEQIVYALKQAENGTGIAELCRTIGVSEQTFYNWRKKYKGLGVSEIRELRMLFDEKEAEAYKSPDIPDGRPSAFSVFREGGR